VPILSPQPLPVERFEEFKRFVLGFDREGWVKATGIALSIQHMLGIAIVGPDAGEEALQLWAAIYNTKPWREASERAQRAAEQPLPYAFSFAFDTPLQGFDEAAVAVPADKILELNSWLRWTLIEFDAAHGQTPEPVETEPPPQTPDQLIDKYLASKPQKPSAAGLSRFRDANHKQLKGTDGFGDTVLKKLFYSRPGVKPNRGGRGSKG
jgi:hypothetical protein